MHERLHRGSFGWLSRRLLGSVGLVFGVRDERVEHGLRAAGGIVEGRDELALIPGSPRGRTGAGRARRSCRRVGNRGFFRHFRGAPMRSARARAPNAAARCPRGRRAPCAGGAPRRAAAGGRAGRRSAWIHRRLGAVTCVRTRVSHSADANQPAKIARNSPRSAGNAALLRRAAPCRARRARCACIRAQGTSARRNGPRSRCAGGPTASRRSCRDVPAFPS